MTNTQKSTSDNPRLRPMSEDEFKIVQNVRKMLHEGGFAVVPCSEGGKNPLFSKWPAFRYDPDDPEPIIPRTLNNDGKPTRAVHAGTGIKAIGLVCIDIDIDDEQLAKAVRHGIEVTVGDAGAVRYRENSPRRMLFYRAGFRETVWDGGGNVEIFANSASKFIQVHGRHPSGPWLRYEGDQLWDLNIDDLPYLEQEDLMIVQGIKERYAPPEQVVRMSRAGPPIGQLLMDFMEGDSITPAVMEITRLMLYEYNASERLIEDIVVSIAEAQIKLGNQVARYENLLKQVDRSRQRVPLIEGYARKYFAMVEQDMKEGTVRGKILEENRQATIENFKHFAGKMDAADRAKAITWMQGLSDDG